MSYKTYIAHENETVFDLAINLYKDARGISNIIMLNPTLDLDSETYFGQAIIYDDSVVYKKEVLIAGVPEPERKKWIIRSGQSVYDLALQIYGDISSVDKIMRIFSDLTDPSAGTLLATESTDNYLANSFFSQKIIATSPVVDPSTLWILATGFWNDEGIWVDEEVWID